MLVITGLGDSCASEEGQRYGTRGICSEAPQEDPRSLSSKSLCAGWHGWATFLLAPQAEDGRVCRGTTHCASPQRPSGQPSQVTRARAPLPLPPPAQAPVCLRRGCAASDGGLGLESAPPWTRFPGSAESGGVTGLPLW